MKKQQIFLLLVTALCFSSCGQADNSIVPEDFPLESGIRLEKFLKYSENVVGLDCLYFAECEGKEVFGIYSEECDRFMKFYIQNPASKKSYDDFMTYPQDTDITQFLANFGLPVDIKTTDKDINYPYDIYYEAENKYDMLVRVTIRKIYDDDYNFTVTVNTSRWWREEHGITSSEGDEL